MRDKVVMKFSEYNPKPLFDADHIRKLSVRAGDVLVLTLPPDCEMPEPSYCEQLRDEMRRDTGIPDLPLWIMPHGTRFDVLRKAEPFKSETPAEAIGGYTIVGEGAAEFAEQLKEMQQADPAPSKVNWREFT